MTKGRLEAFSDGVIAILITIMVLELKVPRGTDMEALRPLLPVFLTYILSYARWNAPVDPVTNECLFHATMNVALR
jgi:uncharacterized membrane protein